jgi:hypothetical protein
MSDLSPEASQSLEDPEVPVEDAIEQHERLPGEDDRDDEGLKDLELPDEANPADVVEQHQEAGADDEETYG